MRSSSLGSTVRALLALAAATAAGRGLPAVAQEAPPSRRPRRSMPPASRKSSSRADNGRRPSRCCRSASSCRSWPTSWAPSRSAACDSTVSLALRRLPAVTVVDGQYIYIRGLGERYSSTTLNGAQVPSPDLTRNVIPLDLFPAAIVETLKIQKGYSPDKPAAFGGGNVDVRTHSLPERFVADLEVGTGWNSDSTGRGFTYPGGSDDRWGTDDGTRALPSEISTAINDYTGDITPTGILRALNRDGGFHTLAEAEQINRGIATNLNRNLDLRKQSLDPDINVEATLGNMWQPGESGEWRVAASVAIRRTSGEIASARTARPRARIRLRRDRAHDPPDDADRQVAVGLDWAEEQQLRRRGFTCVIPRTRLRSRSATTSTSRRIPGRSCELPDPVRGTRARGVAAERPPQAGRGDARRARLRAWRKECRGPGVRLVLHRCSADTDIPSEVQLGRRPARSGHR